MPAMLIGMVIAAWPRIVRACSVVRRDAAWRAVTAVIAGSLVLNVIGIWYGLSSHGTWLGDEIGPNQVIVAISQLFSRGWWAWYPPLHYYILAAVDSPVVLLERVGRIDPRSLFWFDVMFLLDRLVSVVAAVGVLIATYVSGAEAFSKRVGLFAAASLALVGLFICYSKTANVDMPQTIGTAFPSRNRPRLDDFHVDIVDSVGSLKDDAPAFYLFDADYARAIEPDSSMGELIAGLRRETLGYRLALQYRAPAPWAWLPGAHPDLVGPRLDRSTSSFREINPTFEVYKRAP